MADLSIFKVSPGNIAEEADTYPCVLVIVKSSETGNLIGYWSDISWLYYGVNRKTLKIIDFTETTKIITYSTYYQINNSNSEQLVENNKCLISRPPLSQEQTISLLDQIQRKCDIYAYAARRIEALSILADNVVDNYILLLDPVFEYLDNRNEIRQSLMNIKADLNKEYWKGEDSINYTYFSMDQSVDKSELMKCMHSGVDHSAHKPKVLNYADLNSCNLYEEIQLNVSKLPDKSRSSPTKRLSVREQITKARTETLQFLTDYPLIFSEASLANIIKIIEILKTMNFDALLNRLIIACLNSSELFYLINLIQENKDYFRNCSAISNLAVYEQQQIYLNNEQIDEEIIYIFDYQKLSDQKCQFLFDFKLHQVIVSHYLGLAVNKLDLSSSYLTGPIIAACSTTDSYKTEIEIYKNLDLLYSAYYSKFDDPQAYYRKQRKLCKSVEIKCLDYPKYQITLDDTSFNFTQIPTNAVIIVVDQKVEFELTAQKHIAVLMEYDANSTITKLGLRYDVQTKYRLFHIISGTKSDILKQSVPARRGWITNFETYLSASYLNCFSFNYALPLKLSSYYFDDPLDFEKLDPCEEYLIWLNRGIYIDWGNCSKQQEIIIDYIRAQADWTIKDIDVQSQRGKLNLLPSMVYNK